MRENMWHRIEEAKIFSVELIAVILFIAAVFSFDPEAKSNDIAVAEVFLGMILFGFSGFLSRATESKIGDFIAIASGCMGILVVLLIPSGAFASLALFPWVLASALVLSCGAYFMGKRTRGRTC